MKNIRSPFAAKPFPPRLEVKMRKLLISAILVLILSGCGYSHTTSIVVSSLEGAGVGIAAYGANTVIDVRSKQGIGGMVLYSKDGNWPKRLIVRLYLNGLEGFDVVVGDRLHSCGITSGEDQILHQEIRHTGSTSSKILKSSDRMWIPIKHRQFDGGESSDSYFEIVLIPSKLFANEEKIGINWVDFYR